MKKKRGFTFLEILVVVAVMSILLIVFMPNLLKYIDKIKTEKLRAEMLDMKKQAMLFYEKHGRWPGKFSDFLSISGRTSPHTPWGQPYRMDEYYFYADVPRDSVAANMQAVSVVRDKSTVKMFFREFYLTIKDQNFSYKAYPIVIQDNSMYNNSMEFFEDLSRPCAKADIMNIYSVHHRTVDMLVVVIEANEPSGGAVDSFFLSDFYVSGASPISFNDYNISYDQVNNTVSATSINGSYSGIAFEMPFNQSWEISFTLTQFTGVGSVFFGYTSSHVGNFLDFGSGGSTAQYIDREYRIVYSH